MSYDKCKYCYEMGFKTNGSGEFICYNMAYTGSCDKNPSTEVNIGFEKCEDTFISNQLLSRNKPCPCGSKKNYKNCCLKTKQ